MKYVPSTKVLGISFLLDELVNDAVPINNSFKNILLFIPIIIPVRIDLELNASYIISLIMFGNM